MRNAVSARQISKTGMKVALVLTTAIYLSGCANLPYVPAANHEPAIPADIPVAAAEPMPVEVAPLDPLNAPPPSAPVMAAPVMAAPMMAGAMLVPAPGAPPADTSQRVPLGSLTPAPVTGAPMSITTPPPSTPPSTPTPPSVRAQVTPDAPSPVRSSVISPPSRTPPVEAPSVVVVQATPTPAVVAPVAPAVPPPTAPILHPPVGSDNARLMLRDPSAMETQETVIISSATAPPVLEGREFIPASVIPLPQPVRPGPGELPMSAGERNVIQRFETLRRLQDENLITQDEYARRRNANIGALLNYTRDPGGIGLERSVPSTEAIVARLTALRRSFEMRAISASQHALERTMILNALLPENPSERAPPAPPPADAIDGAAMVGRLEGLRSRNMISSTEMEAERAAIEHVLETGLLPSQELASAKKPTPAKTTTASAAAAKPAAAPAADPMTTEITGPVLHLASFRSEASARTAWQDALTRNKTALGSLKPIIRRVDLGPERGVFYRLMTGPFNALSDAEAVCIQLKQNNQFCRASADGS
jgi:hypothetical protein